nr:PREDICTED: E3 ubiquitin-protein ligase DTX3L-like isoform X1 [Lepisosteus oculatus]
MTMTPIFDKYVCILPLATVNSTVSNTLKFISTNIMSGGTVIEIFPFMTLTVDLAVFEDEYEAQDIIKRHQQLSVKMKGDKCLEVEGSYEKVDELFAKLCKLRTIKPFRPTKHPPYTKPQQPPHFSQGEPVEVAEPIMEYIEEKYSKELDDIRGHNVIIQRSRSSSKMLINFQSLQPKKGTDFECHCVRERFLTFYQKIATNLQVKTYNTDSVWKTHYKNFEKEFPKLSINSRRDTITVTGSFIDLRRLDKLLQDGETHTTKTHTGSKMLPKNHQLFRSRDSRLSSPPVQNHQKAKEDTCPICLELIKEIDKTTLPRCQHVFCKDCLKTAFDVKPSCPICGIIYGKLKGTQPENGQMDVTILRSSLPGYEMYGTIVIKYHIPSGIQGEEHPNPGTSYEGATRTAYIPDSPEGKKVLKLLQQAFKQKLIFTIGRSSTTGRSNVVTWNDIHHKTHINGGPTKDHLSVGVNVQGVDRTQLLPALSSCSAGRRRRYTGILPSDALFLQAPPTAAMQCNGYVLRHQTAEVLPQTCFHKSSPDRVVSSNTSD